MWKQPEDFVKFFALLKSKKTWTVTISLNFVYFWVVKLKIAMLHLFTKMISFYEFKHVNWNEFCDIVSSKSMHFSTEFQALLQKIQSLNFVSVDPTLFLRQLYFLNLMFPKHIFDQIIWQNVLLFCSAYISPG